MWTFFHKLKIIYDWLPVLWGNWEWDQSFLLDILEFKLRRMGEYHQKDGITLHRQRKAKELFEAAALCKRMNTEDYGSGPFWRPKIKSDFLVRHDLLVEGEDCFIEDPMYLGRYHSDYLYNQDLERLSILFKKHLRTWWD